MLLVDDDADLRRRAQLYLTRQGALVETAANGIEGLNLLLHRDFDVLVTDVVLPQLSGQEFIHEVSAMWPWLGIVVITDFPHHVENTEEWSKRSFGQILTKPLDYRQLVDAIFQCAVEKKQRMIVDDAHPVDRVQRELTNLSMFIEKALSTDDLRKSFCHLTGGLGLLSTSSVVGIFHAGDDSHMILINVLLPVSQEFVRRLEQEMRRRFELLRGQPIDVSALEVVYEGIPPEVTGPKTYTHAFTIPLMIDNQVRGMITLASAYSERLTPLETAFLYQAASQVNMVLVAHSRIRQFALHDTLTGLLNRRGMEQQVRWVWEGCKRRRSPLSVIILDLDHFKTLNDTHGHLIGDRFLEECAQLIRQEVRATDVVARFGGDEILLALADTNEQQAAGFCERLLKRIRDHVFLSDTHQLRFSASAGVASVVPEEQAGSEALDTLMARADRALYEAKRSGRDRFHIWTDARRTSAGLVVMSAKMDMAAGSLTGGGSLKGSILVVDDEPVFLEWVSRVLSENGYAVTAAGSLAHAQQYLRRPEGVLDVLLTDLLLTDGDGLDLVRAAGQISQKPVCLIMTGHLQKESGVEALRHGVFDVLEKPFLEEQLLMAVNRAMEHRHLLQANLRYQNHLEELVTERNEALGAALEEVRESYEFVLQALASMLDVRERQTGEHSLRVAEVSRLLGRQLGLSEKQCQDICEGALLHDIGKIGIPDSILLKKGPLDEAEWEIMKRHPEIGYRVISKGKFLKAAADIVYCHQERYDGTGYPRGLKGEQIPLGARIFSVADAYDAMRSKRSYKDAYSPEETLARILAERGRQFDPAVVDALVQCQREVENIGQWDQSGAASQSAGE